jgi:hypothetical protein
MRHTPPSQRCKPAYVLTIPFSEFLDHTTELSMQLCQLTCQLTVMRQPMDVYLDQVNRIRDLTTRIHRMLALITVTP